ncbi:hypothetical protein WN55_06868 [Dufourea novaeangliae]|uniref:Uncharacterized protein n=1 Tax=Dufourea novaeangliae TaxID=178035 RepID=A0A154PSV4_DUFNO|nr:hypothetical protein WN55_06868 [Dufourea novaeangliae]
MEESKRTDFDTLVSRLDTQYGVGFRFIGAGARTAAPRSYRNALRDVTRTTISAAPAPIEGATTEEFLAPPASLPRVSKLVEQYLRASDSLSIVLAEEGSEGTVQYYIESDTPVSVSLSDPSLFDPDNIFITLPLGPVSEGEMDPKQGKNRPVVVSIEDFIAEGKRKKLPKMAAIQAKPTTHVVGQTGEEARARTPPPCSSSQFPPLRVSPMRMSEDSDDA